MRLYLPVAEPAEQTSAIFLALLTLICANDPCDPAELSALIEELSDDIALGAGAPLDIVIPLT
jgi:hypothetical protein